MSGTMWSTRQTIIFKDDFVEDLLKGFFFNNNVVKKLIPGGRDGGSSGKKECECGGLPKILIGADAFDTVFQNI